MSSPLAKREQDGSNASSTSSLLGRAQPMSTGTIHRSESWGSLYTDSTPYTAGAKSRLTGISDKFSLAPDPRTWGSDLSPDFPEPDDDLHNPDKPQRLRGGFGERGLLNVGCIAVLLVGLIGLFAGYPMAIYFTKTHLDTLGAFNLGGINSTGQVPTMPGNWAMIDADTPKDAYTWKSLNDGSEMDLVFSDEFNLDGRTFYPGDDPYWEAADLHYWATNNLEWYDPAAITTQGGSLIITLEAKETHNLHYQGGMMSTWNKFCFTGGYIEANVSLPGLPNVGGLWPAIWTMGNLGRAGYGATLEGMWPYSYDSCDVGTAPNQTINGQPVAATENGDHKYGGVLSYLPGQKLSRCTCAGQAHPGPKHDNGDYVGRAAPEIDVIEAQVTNGVGQVSQSAQWAPFNHGYIWYNNSDNEIYYNPSITAQNGYIGSITQQATSVVTSTNQKCYEKIDPCYTTYGFEYKPGFDDAYITWIATAVKSWTIKAAGVAADPTVQIADRPIPVEPMYIIVNLGMSENFGDIDFAGIPFPVQMKVDYIRVYQPKNNINVGCDPKDFPTADYITTFNEAYTNPNLTTWRDDFKQPFPKNRLIDQC